MNGSIIAVIIAGIAYAFIDVILKYSIKFENFLLVTIIRSGISVLLLSILAFYIHFHPSSLFYIPDSIDWSKMPMAILLCFVSTNGLFFFMKSIQHTEMSIVVGFNKIQIVLAIIFSLTVLHQAITVQKVIAMLFVIVGIFLLEYIYFIKNKKLSKGLFYSILARVCWSFGYLFVPFIQSFGILVFTMLLESVVLCTNIIYLIFSKEKISLSHVQIKKVIAPLFIVAILGIVGELGNNFAKASMPIVLIAFIGLITPVVSLILSKVILKEQISTIQKLGIALGIAGAFIYSYL